MLKNINPLRTTHNFYINFFLFSAANSLITNTIEPHRVTKNLNQKHLGKLERLIIRLGVFSALSTIPSIFVLAFWVHYYFKYEEWVQDSISTVRISCEVGWHQTGKLKSAAILLDFFLLVL